MPDPLPAACACPRCGTSLPASTGGLCLRCLGENALRLGGEPPPDSFATSSQLTPTSDATRRADVHPAAPAELGPYEIIEELGRGGMGRVYAARHTQLGTVVALKIIAAGRFATAEEEMRFVREAQTAARLKHPHIVAVHDAGRAAGVAYYTMDLVPDGDLAQRLRTRPPAPRDAAALLRKIAGAVAHAHAAGVLHRDLKPSNILLEGDEPRVADFGLAAQLEPGGELTATTRVLGTPHYLAPELAAHGSRAATPASDLYALGAILYELLTGRPPRAAADHEPVSPRLLEPSLPRDLETICLKCLATAPGARYASVTAFADDLGNFLEHRPILARPMSPVGRFARWCRRRPALAAVWFLVVALAAGSASATFVIRRARDRALVAEHSARRQLREARLAQAEAVRLTHRAGRRAEALAAVAAAAQVEPDRAARDSAIASLALRDIALVRRWPIQAPSPLMTVFAADGSDYAVQDGPAFAWRETGTDREFGRMTAPAGVKPLGWPALSRDGRRFAARFSDAVVRVWQRDAAGVTVLREFADRPHPWPRPRPVYGRDLEFSPDGSRLALAHRDGGFSIVSLADGAEVARGRDSHPSTRLQFSPDGRTVAASSAQPAAGHKLHLFEAANGALLRSMDLGGNVFDLAWSPDGALVAATTDAAQVRTFRASTGDPVGNVPVPEGNVARLIFAGDEELVLTGAVEQTFRWRRRRSGEELVQLDGVEMSRAWPTGDGRGFFTTDHVGHGQEFRFVEPTGVRSRRVDGAGTTPSFGALGALAFSRDGRWLAATGTARLAVFRTADLTRVAFGPTVAAGDDTVTVAFAPAGDALLVAGTVSGLQRVPLHEADGKLSLGEATRLLEEKDWQLRGVSADGRRLALADQAAGRVKILEVDGAGVRGVSQWNVPGAYSAAFGPRGDTLLLNVDHSAPNAAGTALRLWNAADGTELAKLDAPISAEADWDVAGGTAVTSNGEALTVLWKIDAAGTWSRGPALSAEVPQGNTTTLALAPGGKVLAVASAKTVHLVDTATGRSFATLRDEVPFGFVNELVFSPDGTRLALLDTEGTVHLWNLPELRGELAKLGLDW